MTITQASSSSASSSTAIGVMPVLQSVSSTPSGIQTVPHSSELAPFTETHELAFGSINIRTTMSDLKHVASLLRLSWAASDGHACQEKVATLFMGYQDLISEAAATSIQFVQGSVQALKYYCVAYRAVEQKGEMGASFAIISRTSQIADKMIACTDRLIERVDRLKEMSDETYSQASSEHLASLRKKKEVEAAAADLRAEQSSKQSKSSDLVGMIAEGKEKEVEAADDLRDARFWSRIGAFVEPVATIVKVPLELISSIKGGAAKATVEALLQGLQSQQQKDEAQLLEISKKIAGLSVDLESEEDEAQKLALRREISELEVEAGLLREKIEKSRGEFEKVAENLQKQEQRAAKRLKEAEEHVRQLRQEQMENNQAIARSLVQLENLTTDADSLEQAAVSLDLAKRTLTKVRTVFVNIGRFWKTTKAGCDALKDLSMLQFFSEHWKDEYIQEIQESQFKWLALANINHFAMIEMGKAAERVDKAFCSLPGPDEVGEVITDLTQAIKGDLTGPRLLTGGDSDDD